MPNWCFNKLTVVDGPEEEKLHFLDLVRKLDFNKVIPQPLEDQINGNDYHSFMYWWRIENWALSGTLTRMRLMRWTGGSHFIPHGVQHFKYSMPYPNCFRT
jgi:hypothetical protein